MNLTVVKMLPWPQRQYATKGRYDSSLKYRAALTAARTAPAPRLTLWWCHALHKASRLSPQGRAAWGCLPGQSWARSGSLQQCVEKWFSLSASSSCSVQLQQKLIAVNWDHLKNLLQMSTAVIAFQGLITSSNKQTPESRPLLSASTPSTAAVCCISTPSTLPGRAGTARNRGRTTAWGLSPRRTLGLNTLFQAERTQYVPSFTALWLIRGQVMHGQRVWCSSPYSPKANPKEGIKSNLTAQDLDHKEQEETGNADVLAVQMLNISSGNAVRMRWGPARLLNPP